MSGLWSNRCLICRNRLIERFELCSGCLAHLHIPENVCLNCGLNLPDGASDLICGQCLHRSPPFPQLTAVCVWNELVQILIHRLKYQRQLVCARVLAYLFRRAMPNHAQRPALVPVPLSRRRLIGRGFNQAEEIGRWCQHYGLGRLHDVGAYRRHAAAQSLQPDSEQRRRNIRGCFYLKKRQLNRSSTALVILDDLVTTGSTVSEFARTLIKGGHKIAAVWCVARVDRR